MEPFDRNCSFRAVDLSYTKEITNELVGRLLVEIFDLVKGGHVGPIHPITVYGFGQVIPALSHIRRGQHIGKIVVSSGEEDVQLPIRPAVRTLQLDPAAAYPLVGGIRGLSCSLAVHMARHGARHIIVMSRSGVGNEASVRVIESCAAYGCAVGEAKGDVADLLVTGLAGDARFGYLFARAFGLLRGSGADAAALLAAAALGLLSAQITKILRLETEMEPGKPLMAYGLDSLSAVELRGWVRQRLDAELSTLDITNASSLVALSEKLVSKMPAKEGREIGRVSLESG